MGTKENPGRFDCYGNALPDEPMFILLGRDPLAPALIERWANHRAALIRAGDRPKADRPMVKEARECAQAMRAWRAANHGKWRAQS